MSAPSFDHVGHWIRSSVMDPTLVRLQNLAVQALHSWYVGFFQIPYVPDVMWRCGLDRGLVALRNWSEAGLIPPPDAHERPVLAEHARVGMRLYRANRLRLLFPVRGAVHTKTQVISGMHDEFVTPRFYEDLEKFGDIPVHLVDGPHWLPRTNPSLVERYLSAFWET